MNLSDQELKALVALNSVGRALEIHELFGEGLAPSELVPRFEKAIPFQAEKEIQRCHEKGIRLLTWFDEDYPPYLRQIAVPPILLYVKGKILEADQAALAIVGSRNASLYGAEQATRFAHELAQSGLTIVSGFARGIDQAAHEGALKVSYGRTLAVLGCGIDYPYPPNRNRYWDRILEQGAVISEYPLGTRPAAYNFPERNRIIAGLAYGVLVVEANLRSGSLITAHLGVEEGREVFAIPGMIHQLNSRGAHLLIKEGAHLVESPKEILEILSFSLSSLVFQKEKESTLPMDFKESDSEPYQEEPTKDTDDEKKLLQLLKQESLTLEELTLQSELSVTSVMTLLINLEIQQKVCKGIDGRFQVPSHKSF